MANWRSLEAHDAADHTHEGVCGILQVNSSTGLCAAEVSDRRHACGLNELPDDEEEPLWKKFFEQFKDPMIGLLLSSAVISFVVGQWDDAISILIVSASAIAASVNCSAHKYELQAITIVTTVAFIQEYKSDQSIAALRDLAPTTCAVLRDGSAQVVQAAQVVPGDIIILRTGDKVPCDCRVISSHGLSIDESSLTGEGRPARKAPPPIPRHRQGSGAGPSTAGSDAQGDGAAADLADLKCIAFMGTFVQSGRGRVVAVATGGDTVLGGMVHLMASTEDGRSPLQERMDALGQTISIVSIAIIVVMVLFGTAVMGRPLLETFTMGVSLAVAAIPEGLPIVVTVTLALSVQRMSKRQAVVKKLPAVEALGCATVVCADKTGTLTANQMTATRVWGFAGPGRPAKAAAAAGQGASGVIAHALLHDLSGAVSRQGALPTTGHTVSLGGGGYVIGADDGPRCNDAPVDAKSCPQLLAVLNSAAICCNAQVGGARGGSARDVHVVGQPTEAAVLVAAEKAGVSARVDCGGQDAAGPGTPSMAAGGDAAGDTLGGDGGNNAPLQRTLEVPFSHGSKWMAVRVRPNRGQPVAAPEGEYGGSPDAGWGAVAGETYHVKGAVEVVAPLCAFALGPHGNAQPLDASHVDAVHAAALDMARQGLRVVAVAAGDSIPQFPPAAKAHSTWPPGENDAPEGEGGGGGASGGVQSATPGQGHGLVFLGLVGIHDAPRQQAESSINALRRGGVATVMITGDSKPTALAIGRQLGLIGSQAEAADDATALSGAEVDQLSPEVLGRRLGSVRVLYRTTPKHKLKIVQALRAAGHVVAMTGDGVNDAPALRAADIGIAMGSGTEVAKQAAHMVLLNDDLASVVAAVREGKGTFFNIRNFCRFQLSTSVAALGLVAVTTALGLPNALSPMMVLFINILMDGAPAISLGVEPVPAAVMDKAPRPRQEPIVTRGLLCRVLMAGAIMLLGTLFVYHRELSADGVVSTRDTTMTFATFVLFDMFNALASRSSTHSVFALGIGANSFFNLAVGGSLLSLLLLVHFPPLQAVFQTQALGAGDWVFVTLLASTVLWADELRKRVVASAAASGNWPLPAYVLGVEEWQGAEDDSQSVGMPACVQQAMCCLRMRGLQRLLGGDAPPGNAAWSALPTDEEHAPGAHRSYADVAAGNHK